MTQDQFAIQYLPELRRDQGDADAAIRYQLMRRYALELLAFLHRTERLPDE
jgi:hypothetical protein